MKQIFSAGKINARRRVVGELLDMAVTSPESAILFEPEQRAKAEYLYYLRKFGVLRTEHGKTYLNVEKFEKYLSTRNRRIAGWLRGAVAGLFGLLFAIRV